MYGTRAWVYFSRSRFCPLWRHVPLLVVLLVSAGLLMLFLWMAPNSAAILINGRARTLEQGQLTEYRSRDGLLWVTLTAQSSKIAVGPLAMMGETYNGDYAGPVLHVRAGDTLRVHLINHLDEPTNIHFHGLRVTPLGNSDNMHVSVAPGHDFTYEIHIPASQPPGLYWYHSHEHGRSQKQVMLGLSGTIIVDRPDGSPRFPPAIAQHLLVFKDIILDGDTGNATLDGTLHHMLQTLNGAVESTFFAHSGQAQLWHVINQSTDRIVHLAVAGHHLRIVGQDGGATVATPDTDELLVPPAARYDVLIDAGAPGSYEIMAKNILTGIDADRKTYRVVGHLIIDDRKAAGLGALPPADLPPDLSENIVDAQRDFYFTETRSFDADQQKFFINNRQFAMDRVDVRVPLGTLEEWTIHNDTDDLHSFHIHQMGFQVAAVNGARVAYNGRIDTVLVPPRGSVALLMPFTDPAMVGRFVFHCHMLRHEDNGMMAQIEVFDPKPWPVIYAVRQFMRHVWWWLHGVPWTMCGLAET